MKMGEGETKDDIGMVMEDESEVCIGNLGGRLVLLFIRASISVCLMVMVVVGVVFLGECFLL